MLLRHELDEMAFAMAFANAAHTGQTRRGGEPFINHPTRVMLGCFKWDVVARTRTGNIALLHDVAEDTQYDLDDIRVLFGRDIATCVDILTRRDGETYKDYIRRVLDSDDVGAVLVKREDAHDNIVSSEKLSEGRSWGQGMAKDRWIPTRDRMDRWLYERGYERA